MVLTVMLVAVFTWLSLIGDAVAQEDYRIERIGREQGLPHSMILSILQDQDGFLWLGTQDGLAKYDGYSFRNYRSDPEDSTTLTGNVIKILSQDREGYIWVATNHYGVNKLDPRTGTVTQYRHDNDDVRTLTSDNITRMIVDVRGRVWVGTDRGLNLYSRNTDDFVRLNHDPHDATTISHDSITALYADPFGNVWIGTLGPELNRIQKDLQVTRILLPDNNDLWQFPLHISGDDKGNVYTTIATPDSIRGYLWHRQSGVLQHPVLKAESLFNEWEVVFEYLDHDSSGDVWIKVWPLEGEHSGLYLLRSGTDGSAHQMRPLIRGNILAFCRDATGIIWIGTETGIVKMVPNRRRFHTYRHDSLEDTSLSNNFIRSIHVDHSKRLWVGTSNGLNRYLGDEEWKRYMYRRSDPGSLSNPAVNVIYEEEDGTLLFGTNFGISVYDPARDVFRADYRINPGKGPVRPEAIWALHRDRKGNLWVGTRVDGVYVFNRKKTLIEHFRYRQGDSGGICDDNVWCITEDSDGNLWIGTNNGLNRWIPERGRFAQYRFDPLDSHSICGNNIWSLSVDRQGRLWVGAFGAGISLYKPQYDGFISFTRKQGLPTEAIFGTLDDTAGRLWISTNIGLVHYDPVTHEVLQIYGEGDGLQGDEFSYKATFKAADGEMFFGGIFGLSRFYPNEIKDNLHTPPIVVTLFKIFDEVVEEDLFNGDSISLNYNQNFFSFEFSALDFTNPARNRYAYMLEGFDPGWIYSEERRYASYTNLDPGVYVFKVKGSNNDGHWNENGASILIEILPPWWMTTWFRVLVVSVGALVVSTGVIARIRSIRRKHRMERKVLESQLQALRAQMNPHFVFNSLNSIQYLILNSDVYNASEYLSKFARLIRIILDNSRYPFIPIGKELECLNVYLELESLRFEQQLRYQVKTDPALLKQEFKIPSMLIQPYVENAIRHGIRHKPEGGTVSVTLYKKQQDMVAIVEDDGIGRRAAMEIKRRSGVTHESIGMSTTKARLDMLNADLQRNINVEVKDLFDEAGRPSGTRVILVIPVDSSEMVDT